MSRTLLIDGDIICFTIASRVETNIAWGGDNDRTREADPEVAKAETKAWIDELVETLDADSAVIALSDPSRRYFRHDIYPQYKQDRTHGETPLLLFFLKDYLRTDEFVSKTKPTLEADDVLGIYASHPTLIDGEKIVVTADKDLLQIPGLHYNPRKTKEGIREVTGAEGDAWFLTQVLTGDTTDGYPGCRGIGPKKADRILAGRTDPKVAWPDILATYAERGFDEDYALTQARVARILRHTDWDYAANRYIPWNP